MFTIKIKKQQSYDIRLTLLSTDPPLDQTMDSDSRYKYVCIIMHRHDLYSKNLNLDQIESRVMILIVINMIF